MDRKWIVSVLLIVCAACNPAGAPNQPSPTQTRSAPAETTRRVPEHRIGVRVVAGQPEFYDKETGRRFTPIGANFVQFGRENDYIVDRLFVPGKYNPGFVDEQFRLMQSLGYTVMRISLDICKQDCIGAKGGGLRADYLDNVVDLLVRAKAHGLFVIVAANDLPLDAGYVPKVEATCCTTFDGYINSHYLSPVGVQQWTQYWKDLVQAFIDRDAPFDAILAYQIRGELFLIPDQPPLSLNSGKVTTANGKTYDLANPTQKNAMIHENVAYWVNTVSAAIHQLDPTALTTIGLFPPNEPNIWRADLNRYVPTAAAFAGSSLDYLALHPYPGYVPIEQMMENYQLQAFTGPVIIGEFGGFKFVFETPQSAAFGLQEWQVASCAYGVQGWTFWHWTGTDDHEVWTGSEGDGAIRETLAPVNRPDPCQRVTFDFFENNLALGKPARASRFTPDGPPEMAFDNSANTYWQSGAGPQQWIEVDLQAPATVREIRLSTSQYPEGDTVHQLFAAGPDHNLRLVHEFRGFTRGDQELKYIFPEPLQDIQILRLVTLESPSWVSWKEIQVFGSP